MKELVSISFSKFESYVNSFTNLSESQKRNFEIKKDHSIRVADLSLYLAGKLNYTDEQCTVAYLSGLLHDVGRFRQIAEYDTLSDEKSVDHGDLAIDLIEEKAFIENMEANVINYILVAIRNHNKFAIQDGLSEIELMYARLLRDADKLDIYKVLIDYYTKRNLTPNHTLSWELPKGSVVSAKVAKEVLAGKLVSKTSVVTELDLKIMQLSWVFDISNRFAIEYLLRNRCLEGIYNTLPKNDLVIEIYRKIKVFVENRMMEK